MYLEVSSVVMLIFLVMLKHIITFTSYGIPTNHILIFATVCNLTHMSWSLVTFFCPLFVIISVSMIRQISCYQYHKVTYNIKHIRLSDSVQLFCSHCPHFKRKFCLIFGFLSEFKNIFCCWLPWITHGLNKWMEVNVTL